MNIYYLKGYIFLFFFVGINISIYSQSSQCLEYVDLDIEKDGFYPQTDNFAIYFMNKDSVFRYNENVQICVDSGSVKKYTVFFYYDNRIIQCPVFFKYPDAENIRISYYTMSDLNIATNDEIIFFCIENKINKKYLKNTDILYSGDELNNDNLFFKFPASYWNKERIPVDKLYYGIIKISIGRIYFIALDYKPLFYFKFW